MKKLYLFFLFVLALTPSLVAGIILIFLYNHPSFLSEKYMLYFFAASIFTMAFALTPSTFIAILSGYFFSWMGLIALVLSYLLAAVLGLYFGKLLKKLNLKLSDKAEGKLAGMLNRLNDNQFLFIIFARLSPVLPFAMTNVALSNLEIKWLKYLGGSLIGMFPRTFIFFYAGKNAGNIWDFLKNPSLEGSYKIVPVLLIIISTMGLLYIVKKSLQSKNQTR